VTNFHHAGKVSPAIVTNCHSGHSGHKGTLLHEPYLRKHRKHGIVEVTFTRRFPEAQETQFVERQSVKSVVRQIGHPRPAYEQQLYLPEVAGNT